MVPKFLYQPDGLQQLAQFYTAWIVMYLVIHLIWDAWSKHTARFTLKCLRNKTSEMFAAATFASSIYLLSVVVLGEGVGALKEGAVLPIVLSALSGVVISIGQLDPVPEPYKQKQDNPVPAQERDTEPA